MNLIDLFRNWFFSLISKQNLLIVSFQGFVEMVLMKWKTILGPSCSFSSLVEITQVIWHFWQWLEKLVGDVWTKWSLKFSNTDLLKTQLLIQINSPLPLKKRKFFFFNAVLHFSKRPTPKVCYPIDLVSIYWNGIKVRLQVNDIGRGTNISIHLDSNFKVLLLFMNSKHLSVKLSLQTTSV